MVVNADDPRVDGGLASESRAPVVRVSLDDPGADFSARDIVVRRRRAPSSRCSRRACPRRGCASPLAGPPQRLATRSARSRSSRGVGPLGRRDRARAAAIRRREAAAGDQGREERHPPRGRLRAPPDRGARHAPGGASARFPGRRLWALFEPRSNTAGPQDVRGGLRGRVLRAPTRSSLAPVFHAQRLAPDSRLDREALVARFAAARQAGLRARRRSPRSRRSCGARRVPATCCF